MQGVQADRKFRRAASSRKTIRFRMITWPRRHFMGNPAESGSEVPIETPRRSAVFAGKINRTGVDLTDSYRIAIRY